jgi:hypothetical protein
LFAAGSAAKKKHRKDLRIILDFEQELLKARFHVSTHKSYAKV